MKSNHIAVLIPCYNEAQTIRKVIRDFRKSIPDAVIYVYDNNSSDGTAEIAAQEKAVVRHVILQGKGNVVRQMFLDIDADCYIMVDGDDTYPAEYAATMSELVLGKGYDMVVGDRLTSTYFDENKRRFHNMGNALVRKIVNLLFRSDIKDIMTGYRAFSYRFVKTYPVVFKGFEIETDMTIYAVENNMAIYNYEIPYRDRPAGSESKLNTYSDGIRVLMTIISQYRLYHPFVFFGTISLFLTCTAIGFFIPIVEIYAETGMVPNFPTLIVCGFTLMAALLLFVAGLILQNIALRNRQDFETKLHIACRR